jgi:tRNA G10  N-methylase Trm11
VAAASVRSTVPFNAERTVTTTGWRATCAHANLAPVPCTVLDPFCGAGTTLLVADRLDRNAIGIELNPTYAEMARKRIRGDAPMFVQID